MVKIWDMDGATFFWEPSNDYLTSVMYVIDQNCIENHQELVPVEGLGARSDYVDSSRDVLQDEKIVCLAEEEQFVGTTLVNAVNVLQSDTGDVRMIADSHRGRNERLQWRWISAGEY